MFELFEASFFFQHHGESLCFARLQSCFFSLKLTASFLEGTAQVLQHSDERLHTHTHAALSTLQGDWMFNLFTLTHWPGCVFRWPPGAAAPPADQSLICPWTSLSRLLAAGSVSDSSGWPPVPDRGRTGSSAPPPARSADGRASRTRWPPPEPGEGTTADQGQTDSRTLAWRHDVSVSLRMCIRSHLALSELVAVDYFLQLAQGGVLPFHHLIQLLSLKAEWICMSTFSTGAGGTSHWHTAQ